MVSSFVMSNLHVVVLSDLVVHGVNGFDNSTDGGETCNKHELVILNVEGEHCYVLEEEVGDHSHEAQKHR